MKNDARKKLACIKEGKKKSEPCGVRSSDLWISGRENNHCANKATDVSVGETYR